MSVLTGSFIVVGDSITLGSGPVSTTPYGTRIATDLSLTVHVDAIGGTGWDHGSTGIVNGANSLINRASANVDTPYVLNNPQPFLILFAGTNDLSNGYTGAQTYASFQTYFNARIAAGWTRNRIILCPVTSSSALNNTERNAYNNSIISGSSTDKYLVAHLELDSRIGADSSYSNTTYFQDGLHPTEAGQQIIADIIESVNYPIISRGLNRWRNL